MRQKIRNKLSYFFREGLSVRQKIINNILLIIVATQIPFLIFSIIIKKALLVNLIHVGLIVFLIDILYLINKYSRLKWPIHVLIVGVCYVILPIFFFRVGGVQSAVPMWMLLGILFIWVALDGVARTVHYVVDLVIISACIILQYTHPELLVYFEKDYQKGTDILVAFIVTSYVIGTTTRYAIYAYDNQAQKLQKSELRYKELNDELEKANEGLKRASEAKSNFLANMSHEIRTPINAVLGMNEMILRESDDKNVLDYANDIDSAGHQLLSIINDILDFSKIESGHMEIHPVEYELFSVMNDCYNMIIMRAKVKNLRVELENNPHMPAFLYGDEVRVRQVIMNLLTNAVKYTMDGYVRLTLDFDKIDDETINVKIVVKDTGVGIAEEDMPALFAAFQRIDELTNRTIEGTGLGLAITNKFVEMMDGHIEVESAKGVGSTFTVVIPQKIASKNEVGDFASKYRHKEFLEGDYGNAGGTGAMSNAAKTPHVGDEKIDGASKLKAPEDKKKEASFIAPEARVLVVDDVKMNLNVVRLLLKNTQMEIDLAGSGEQCLQYTMMKHYDVILMDHMMPNMDGIETFHRVQAQDNGLNKNTPVIMLTANAIQSVDKMYMGEGFASYITKPVKADALEAELTKILPKEKVILNDK